MKQQVGLTIQMLALVFAVLGYAFASWAMASKKFFSRRVRIQNDRGQTVAAAGTSSFAILATSE